MCFHASGMRSNTYVRKMQQTSNCKLQNKMELNKFPLYDYGSIRFAAQLCCSSFSSLPSNRASARWLLTSDDQVTNSEDEAGRLCSPELSATLASCNCAMDAAFAAARTTARPTMPNAWCAKPRRHVGLILGHSFFLLFRKAVARH